MSAALPARWPRPAEALRRILDSVFRRRTVVTPSAEFGLLSSRGYSGRLFPDPRAGRELLGERVGALLAAGALDEGHGDLFDPMIESLVVQWRNLVDEEHDDNQRLLRTYEAEAMAEVERQRAQLAYVRERLADADADVARIHDLRANPGAAADEPAAGAL
jgi:hypothetical protein